MGGYCRYCDHRCFVPRLLKDGKAVILATCQAGMNNDLAKTGQTHETAVNVVTDPEAAARIYAAPEPLRPEEFCGFCGHHSEAHQYEAAAAAGVPCVGCKGGICLRDICQDCDLTVVNVDGVWVVVAESSSADGLSYCPPDPDAEGHGPHRPFERVRPPR